MKQEPESQRLKQSSNQQVTSGIGTAVVVIVQLGMLLLAWRAIGLAGLVLALSGAQTEDLVTPLVLQGLGLAIALGGSWIWPRKERGILTVIGLLLLVMGVCGAATSHM